MMDGGREKPIIKFNTVVSFAFAVLICTSSANALKAGKVYSVGFLGLGKPHTYQTRLTAFRRELREQKFQEGKNLEIEERYARGMSERVPALSEELVRLKPDVIVIHGSTAIQVVRRLDRTVPIVFPVYADPVGSGAVTSLARPGGNVTGLSDYHTDLVVKRLELLKEVVPSAQNIAVLWDPAISVLQRQWKQIHAAGPRMGLKLLSMGVSSPADFGRALAKMRKERPDGIVVFGYPTIGRYRARTLEFALKNRLPTIFTTERNVRAGGLMSYGANFLDLYRRAATFVARILKGTKPADLPVEQPKKFDLVINLKTAKALSITIPPEVLFRATRVIK
jgi:putative ABC transport system substrate-binding protein